ncbi:conserved hypothetical protein [Psychromonas ingrahamii 37]|uniref:DUF1840 domain-containing protein n=1 Tax=Psychromonas ingrahamii (strain DSM 17664 / CCUG 51855 / 37) TaxID=357804 RepID=A1SRM0_PSYIN|nr:DUF1840 domain-containing protein [Psychromonas ingrahamii]ABM02135.1 conserved hypothetical protein [Psychromonas ingrahamii 37]
MLVTFSCPAYADITMFGDVAIKLLKIMGHSGTVPGAIGAEDVQAALLSLETATKPSPEPITPIKQEDDENDENDEPAISLSHRALPLIELLRAAAEEKCNVMWDGNQ